MVKFCTVNRFGIPYAYYEIYCTDCNWMGELKATVGDEWEEFYLCPKCGSDDLDEFDDGVDEEYIHLKTEWGSHEHVDPWPILLCKIIWRKIRRLK